MLSKPLWWCFWALSCIAWTLLLIQYSTAKNDTIILQPQVGVGEKSADSSRLSLSVQKSSSILSQEDTIFNPKDSEKVSVVEETANKPCININSACLEDLTTLPGIGPVLAQRIIAYRESNRRFLQASELIQIKGIGEAKLNKIKDQICF